MLIDSHCHLDFPELAANRAGVLARAAEAGVTGMVTISTRVREFEGVKAIAEAHDNVWCSVGTHPHHAHEELDRLSCDNGLDDARLTDCIQAVRITECENVDSIARVGACSRAKLCAR